MPQNNTYAADVDFDQYAAELSFDSAVFWILWEDGAIMTWEDGEVMIWENG